MEPFILSEEQQVAICGIVKVYVEEFGLEHVQIVMPGSWQNLDVELNSCSLQLTFHETESLIVIADFNGSKVSKEFSSSKSQTVLNS